MQGAGVLDIRISDSKSCALVGHMGSTIQACTWVVFGFASTLRSHRIRGLLSSFCLPSLSHGTADIVVYEWELLVIRVHIYAVEQPLVCCASFRAGSRMSPSIFGDSASSKTHRWRSGSALLPFAGVAVFLYFGAFARAHFDPQKNSMFGASNLSGVTQEP